jgi:hypothetical protein
MSVRGVALRVAIAVGVLVACCSAPALASVAHPYISSFGSFAHVGGVAVSQSSGDVYVFDTGAEEVLKYTAAGAPAEFTSTKTNAITGVGSGGSSESEIAVDSSTGPTKGDIYLVGSAGLVIYNEAGDKIGQLTEEAGKPWGYPCGVAVDSSGNVYVGLYGDLVNRYTPSANPVADSDYSASLFGVHEVCNVAADSVGEAYVDSWPNGPITRYTASQFSVLEVPAIGTEVEDSGSTLTTDPADDHVYVDGGSHVTELGAHGEPFGEPVSTFAAKGEGAISGSEGIAVNATSGEIYVSDGQGKLSVFGPAAFTPTVITGAASGLTGHTATLSGSVNPEGSPITECKFEYGATSAYGQTAPCSISPGSGTTPVAVTAAITGLKSATTYHYRLSATSTVGESTGEDEALTTVSSTITGGASEVTLHGATLSGTINPEGLAVIACEFEYGPTSAYGQSVPCATSPGSGSAPVGVTGSVTGLIPNATYHYRLVVTDETGENFGLAQLFTTEGPLASGLQGLPDGRVYELVSPLNNGDAEVYRQEAAGESYSNDGTLLPFQAAADGSGVVYVGGPSTGGNESAGYGGGNQYLATRSASGTWTQSNISPPGFRSAVFQGFSSNLAVGFLDSLEPMASNVPGFGEEVKYGGTYDVLYSTNTGTVGEYSPAFTVTPPNRSKIDFRSANVPAQFGGTSGRNYNNRTLAYAGASADSTHVLFEANDALTPEAEGGTASHYEEDNNLYETVGGQLRLVNVLPDGSTKANATFGAPALEGNGAPSESGSPDFSNVISENGSRVFWTDLNTGHIYMRENGTRTVEISAGGRYWTATASGSEVFYTNGDLYEYDVESGQTTDLTPGVAVQGVIGASENGEYIYYVTESLELTLWHDGVTTQIKTLSAEDNKGYADDWESGLRNRTAEVSADGHGVVFASSEGLPNASHVEVYDAASNQLYCASCGSGGANGVLPSDFSNTYLKRWISAEGSRVFFDSREALVPQDTNGKLDAYEWEAPGTGSCESGTGCIYLLSSGTSADESYFVDASVNGDDAFIVTRAKLLPSDENELYDLYDARVGGVTPTAAPACTGTGCQGLPGVPPIFATPSSVTFEGVGNFAVPAPVVKATQPKKKKKKAKPKRSKRKAKHEKAKKGSKASRHARDARERKHSRGNGGQS